MVLFKVVAYSICLLNEYSWLNTSQFIHLFSKKVNQIKKNAIKDMVEPIFRGFKSRNMKLKHEFFL